MKSVEDALYNWITIKVVSDARPEDKAAQKTTSMFEEILAEQFQVTNLLVEKNRGMYEITYEEKGVGKSSKLPSELVEIMLEQINLEPDKYKNYN